MIKLGIVSDSHDREIWLDAFAAVCRREKYDAVFHLGDVESDARWLARQIDCPLIAVPGNCDPFSKTPDEAVETFEGRRVFAAHGHRQGVKSGLMRLSYRVEEVGADVALYGHTHAPGIDWAGRTLLMNPGALMNGCYGELLIDGERLVPYLRNLKGERT